MKCGLRWASTGYCMPPAEPQSEQDRLARSRLEVLLRQGSGVNTRHHLPGDPGDLGGLKGSRRHDTNTGNERGHGLCWLLAYHSGYLDCGNGMGQQIELDYRSVTVLGRAKVPEEYSLCITSTYGWGGVCLYVSVPVWSAESGISIREVQSNQLIRVILTQPTHSIEVLSTTCG